MDINSEINCVQRVSNTEVLRIHIGFFLPLARNTVCQNKRGVDLWLMGQLEKQRLIMAAFERGKNAPTEMNKVMSDCWSLCFGTTRT